LELQLKLGAGPAVQAPDQLVLSLTRCPGVGDTVGKGRDQTGVLGNDIEVRPSEIVTMPMYAGLDRTQTSRSG
jgi:hypothetical protein